MEKIVLTIDETTCDRNGKTLEMVEGLKEKMKEYGTIIPFDEAVNAERSEYQDVINTQREKIEEIKSYGVDEMELRVLESIREVRERDRIKSEAENESLRNALANAKKDIDDIRSGIMSALGL